MLSKEAKRKIKNHNARMKTIDKAMKNNCLGKAYELLAKEVEKTKACCIVTNSTENK